MPVSVYSVVHISGFIDLAYLGTDQLELSCNSSNLVCPIYLLVINESNSVYQSVNLKTISWMDMICMYYCRVHVNNTRVIQFTQSG